MSDQWYFAGLNANRVLEDVQEPDGTPLDVRRFTPMPDVSQSRSGPTDIIFASWTQLIFRTEDKLLLRGFRAGDIDFDDASEIVSIIGDHNGLWGALDNLGRFYRQIEQNDDLPSVLSLVTQHARHPRLAKVSITGANRIAVALKQDATDNVIHIKHFRDLKHFDGWYEDSTQPGNSPTAEHTVPGKLRQLITNQTSYFLLTEDHDVYSWGDSRFRGLGRPIDQYPAHTPARLDSCMGEIIVKIRGGGAMFAALTQTGQVYIWTGNGPLTSGTLDMHAGTNPGEMVGVILEDEDGNERVFDDVAVGNGHVLLKCPDGRLFAAGDNRNGQLGLDSEESFYSDWIEVMPSGCSFIRAGSRMSVVKASFQGQAEEMDEA